ncbi:RsmD family RNA methyltransferase [Helicobacter trogontum]|uniref:Adenine methyltransferase n=1 Tax=Helicobacter trogontum TaxID=50960 RepID=A0A4V6I3E6_9HELI|nr:RsmD family RNA methyltransferase [Helicobacter trogontum]MCI5787117.1 RsmD family RNA methyltransferase [Helicobacter trogontum]MDY5184485.1 RsmD family RNA methyltransferase [Helicobacter trogontum]TLD99722.1 adenine methyltransferase [Helicobacter trogontum]
MRKHQKTQHTQGKKEKFAINRGKYKGLGLFLESNNTTRPTKALVKKSFFDVMQYSLYNKIFVECFAGSGQMGFEALSLGASEVVFFEKNAEAFKNLCNNISLFWEKHVRYHANTQDSMSKTMPLSISAHYKDCLQCQDSIMNFAKNADFQVKNDTIAPLSSIEQTRQFVLYMDPPFACRKGFEDIYAKIWCFMKSFDENFVQKVDMIVIESMSDIHLDTQVGIFHLVKKSKFGQTTLMYFTK